MKPRKVYVAKTEHFDILFPEVFKEIYKDLPVSFFHVCDEEDLQAQLEKMWDEPDELPAFERIYSFERTASIILKAFNYKSE